MVDWLSSMKQTYEYYTVDPITWKDKKMLENITSCIISHDSSVETLGSATINMTEQIDETYVRVYLITIQNGVKEKIPLCTVLAQTPSSSFDGKNKDVSVDAYTPLIELKEKQPPIGYSITKADSNNEPILNIAYRLINDNARAPIVSTSGTKKLEDNYVANTDDTWLSFITDLLSNAEYKLGLDELGRILLVPDQKTESLQPIWTYNDNNSSILQPDIIVNRDIYGIPNVVEVLYSNGSVNYYYKAINDDENSTTSIINRGREIVHRVTELSFIPGSKEQVQEYANKLLKELSTVEYSVTYTHGYCPVKVGDCVMLNYARADLKNIKAKVVSQSIKCEPGCQVTEKAVFTSSLWR